jgi:hypothetical protein
VTPLYPQKLALTSPTGGGRSVGIVRSRTKATEFSFNTGDKWERVSHTESCFGGLEVVCCLSVPNFVGSNPAKAVRIFQGEKILSVPSFGGEVKPSVPCRRFEACKRSLNGTWKSPFMQNYRPTFSPTVPPFTARISRIVLTSRRLVAEIGMSKTMVGGGRSGLHNKPIGCGASEAYAPGPVHE